jgi:hypothetical protein
MQVRPRVTPGQIAGNCATFNSARGSVAQRGGSLVCSQPKHDAAHGRRCIKMVILVRDHHVDPAAPLGHKGTRSNVRLRPVAAANSGCRCLRSLRTMALLSRARWAFTGDPELPLLAQAASAARSAVRRWAASPGLIRNGP